MMNPQALSIRRKKLAVLLLDARLATGKTIEECASIIGISPAEYERFESGEKSPSLPELEALTYYFQVPLDHFWGNIAISERPGETESNDKLRQVIALRQRIVGVLIRQARRDHNLSLADLGARVNISAEQLERYELGEESISLPELEILVKFLGRSIQEFYDSHGPIGAWLREQRAVKQFSEMPPNLQTFVSKPINRPYLELAERLSEMSVEKLRGVAEGLLEITL